MRCKIVSQSTLVVAGLGIAMSVSTDAYSQTEPPTQTAIQNNGTQCVLLPGYSGLWWDWQGVRNLTSDYIAISCPLTQPSGDTVTVANKISDIEVHYGGDTPGCYLSVKDWVNGYYFSPDLAAGTSATSGTPVLKLAGSYAMGGTGGAFSIVLQCVLPPGTLIFGSTAVKEVDAITGGT